MESAFDDPMLQRIRAQRISAQRISAQLIRTGQLYRDAKVFDWNDTVGIMCIDT